MLDLQLVVSLVAVVSVCVIVMSSKFIFLDMTTSSTGWRV